MRILSRYVLRHFLPPATLGLLAFLAIFVVIDLADRLNGFLDRDVAAETILAYYLYYLPYILVLVLPMAMLLGSLFCMGGLSRHQELTAMKSAGISLYRIVLPVQAFSLLVSVGVVAFSDQVVPRANRHRAEIEPAGYRNERLSDLYGARSRVALVDQEGQVLSVGEYRPKDHVGETVVLHYRSDGAIYQTITADRMRWDGDQWIFYDGVVRRFRDSQPGYAEFRTTTPEGLSIRPEDVASQVLSIDQMTNAGLREFIRRKNRYGGETDRERVGLHLRLAFPFASFVIVLFGVPLSSRTRPAGKPLLFGLCLLTSFVYYGCIQAGRAMGWNGLIPPFWGGWGANLLFLCVGAGLLVKTHK